MANSGPLLSTQLYAAGDVRANENTELTSLTTLFVRNHNAIATELAQENPALFGFTSWTDENLYQEARKINIAEYQNIIYTQYLPALLGPDAPTYTGYNSTVNPSIATEFSTVAFRFGHSMLNNTVRATPTTVPPLALFLWRRTSSTRTSSTPTAPSTPPPASPRRTSGPFSRGTRTTAPRRWIAWPSPRSATSCSATGVGART